MTTAELRTINQAQPFRPYTIRTSEGGAILIPHPDFLFIPPVGTTLFAVRPEGGFDIIAAEHVTKVEFREPTAK